MSPASYKYEHFDTRTSHDICVCLTAITNKFLKMPGWFNEIERNLRLFLTWPQTAADCYGFEPKVIYTMPRETESEKNEHDLSLNLLDIIHLFSHYFAITLWIFSLCKYVILNIRWLIEMLQIF